MEQSRCIRGLAPERSIHRLCPESIRHSLYHPTAHTPLGLDKTDPVSSIGPDGGSAEFGGDNSRSFADLRRRLGRDNSL